MEKIFVIRSSNQEIDNLVSQLSLRVSDIQTYDNIFEFRKHIIEEIPEAILVADNLKEKKIEDLLKSIQNSANLEKVPIIALVCSGDKEIVGKFLNNGASDAIYSPFSLNELTVRLNLRFEEIQSRQSFTSGDFFFNEAQEKEQGRRTGIFRFYNHQNAEVGDICIKDGRLVHATYGSLIKADAFLQISSNTGLKFVFHDEDDIKIKSINEGITGLLLEASKLKDEINMQNKDQLDEYKFLVIDANRIARIMANRVIKNLGFFCKITSPAEMTVRFMANYAPNLIIIDYTCRELIMNMLWPEGRKDVDIPVIIYCDEDVKDINSAKIGNHNICSVLYKKQFHKEIKSVLQVLNIL